MFLNRLKLQLNWLFGYVCVCLVYDLNETGFHYSLHYNLRLCISKVHHSNHDDAIMTSDYSAYTACHIGMTFGERCTLLVSV